MAQIKKKKKKMAQILRFFVTARSFSSTLTLMNAEFCQILKYLREKNAFLGGMEKDNQNT